MAAFRMSTIETIPVAVKPAAKKSCWIQVLSHLSPRYGGIASSVPHLARATEAAGSRLCPVIGFCDETEFSQLSDVQRQGIRNYSPSRARWMIDSQLRRGMLDAIKKTSGVHIHGVWETHCMIAAGMAREAKRPYIISVHGMLEQWALRNKRLKKALYAALFEIRRMQRAACLRALSVDEVDDYRRLGLTNPIAIIPNGIDEPPSISPDLFLAGYPELQGKRIVLFLGRLHAKKGLDLLLQAWARTGEFRADARLVIAGPDSDNMQATLTRQASELSIGQSVTFTGMLEGDFKWSALAASSLFVLPSYSEGFSMAILEAMAMGVPVLVTRECHIPEAASHQCGWVIPAAVAPLEQALAEFFKTGIDDALRMGERGKDLARTRFHSDVVGRQMTQVYDWLEGGAKPSAVEIV